MAEIQQAGSLGDPTALESELSQAASGFKTIYFDNNDCIYTEEEVKNGATDSSSLTKLKVRVPEQERRKFNEV